MRHSSFYAPACAGIVISCSLRILQVTKRGLYQIMTFAQPMEFLDYNLFYRKEAR